MSKRLDRLRIQQRAVRVLEEYQFKQLPIDPKLVAQNAKNEIQPKDDCEAGVSGMLLRQGEKFCIIYATYLNNLGFENFSIAHELGHYFLDGHPEQVFQNDIIHTSHAGFISDSQLEREAGTFAASLLMPDFLFKDHLAEFEKGMTCIEAMAKMCNTSLTATAIRYVELAEDKVMVLVSENGIVSFCCVSDPVLKLGDIEKPKKGDRILKGSATERFSQDPTLMFKPEPLWAETDFRGWLECRKSKQAAEEAKGLGKYGRVLTVIS